MIGPGCDRGREGTTCTGMSGNESRLPGRLAAARCGSRGEVRRGSVLPGPKLVTDRERIDRGPGQCRASPMRPAARPRLAWRQPAPR